MRIRSILITIALVCGAVVTGILSIERLWHVGLLGCGLGSGCAAAAESPFARIGRLPVAHPGFAYAIAMLLAWIVSGRRATLPLLYAARLGAFVSAVFAVLVFEHGYWCGYCIAAHACNLLTWALLEWMPRSPGWRTAFIVLACTFGSVLGAVAIIKPQLDRRKFEERQQHVNAVIDSIVAEAKHGTKCWLPVPEPNEGIRRGQADASIRITVFLDYQCGYCRVVAREVGLVSGLPGVAVTWRQLPHGWPCNPRLKGNLHDCACRCSRLAVAVGGTPDFLRVHEWLLEREGRVTEEDIEDALPMWVGIDPATFWKRYHAASIREAIRADLELAERMNLRATPTIFINGELFESPNIGEAVRNISGRLQPLR